MADLAYRSRGFQQRLATFCETATVPQHIVDTVSKILADIRGKGDKGITATIRRIDGLRLKPSQFRISESELIGSVRKLEKWKLKAIKESIATARWM